MFNKFSKFVRIMSVLGEITKNQNIPQHNKSSKDQCIFSDTSNVFAHLEPFYYYIIMVGSI